MKKIYEVLFWILGTSSVVFIFLFAVFLGASIGHDFNQWGYRAYFDSWEVTIEPEISCLRLRDTWAQGRGNLIIFDGCARQVKMSNRSLSTWNVLHWENETVITEINNQTFSTTAEEKYVLKIPVEYNQSISVISIPLEVVNGTRENIMGLLTIFFPATALLILFAVYLFREKPEITLIRKLRKVFFYIIMSIILFCLLLFTPPLLHNIFGIMFIFLVVPFLVLIFPFLLILLIITQIAIWIRKEEINHHQKHKI